MAICLLVRRMDTISMDYVPVELVSIAALLEHVIVVTIGSFLLFVLSAILTIVTMNI